VVRCLDELAKQFDVVTMARHAELILERGGLDIAMPSSIAMEATV
jgi:hypothetical protein